MSKIKTAAIALSIIISVIVSLTVSMLITMSIHDEISPPLPQANALIEEHRGKSYIIFDYEGTHYVVEFRGGAEQGTPA